MTPEQKKKAAEIASVAEIFAFARKCLEAEDPIDEIEKRIGLDEFTALVVGGEYLIARENAMATVGAYISPSIPHALDEPVLISVDEVMTDALERGVEKGIVCPNCGRYLISTTVPCPNCGTLDAPD